MANNVDPESSLIWICTVSALYAYAFLLAVYHTFRQAQQEPKECMLWVINVGIKHGFSCINISQVPWEVFKTEASTSQGTWRMLMHWKTMFDCYYCIKIENICYISHYFLHYFVSLFHRCLANVISTDYACSRAGQYTSRNGSKSVASVWSYWKLLSYALTAHELPC